MYSTISSGHSILPVVARYLGGNPLWEFGSIDVEMSFSLDNPGLGALMSTATLSPHSGYPWSSAVYDSLGSGHLAYSGNAAFPGFPKRPAL